MTVGLFNAIIEDITSEDLGFKKEDIIYMRPKNNNIVVKIKRVDSGDNPNACVYDKTGEWLDWLWV